MTEGNRGFPDEIFENGFEGDPGFVDAENHDFYLGRNSNAIDKGSSELALILMGIKDLPDLILILGPMKIN